VSVRQFSGGDEDDDNNVVLPCKTLDCAFFRGHLRRIRGDRKSTAFGTLEMATPFEHVLFMSSVAEIRATQAAKKQSTRQRTIAKTTLQSSFRSSDLGHGQRIGFVVRSVVKAWNKLADALNLKNVEDMMTPYILFERESMRIFQLTGLVAGLLLSRALLCSTNSVPRGLPNASIPVRWDITLRWMPNWEFRPLNRLIFNH
jgi:hypothetical protein